MANWNVSHIEVQDVGSLTGVIVKAQFDEFAITVDGQSI